MGVPWGRLGHKGILWSLAWGLGRSLVPGVVPGVEENRVETGVVPVPALVHVVSHADDTSTDFKIGEGLTVDSLSLSLS